MTFGDLTPEKIGDLLGSYAERLGLAKDFNHYLNVVKDRKYGMLIFLTGVRRVKPFKINKAGFGSMTAWLSVETIEQIKLLTGAG